MYTNDKITKKGEITQSGTFDCEKKTFYLFLMPKNEAANAVVLLNVALCGESKMSECPFSPNEWNPVSVAKISVSSTILSNYRVFWGGE